MIKTGLYRAGWMWLLMAVHFTGAGQVPRAAGNAPNDHVSADLAGTLGTYANPPRFPVVIDIYATRHSRLGDSTPEYVREVLDAGLKFADGVFIYRHQDPVAHADKYQIVREGIRKFRNE